MRRIPVRVVCHAIFRTELFPQQVRQLHQQVATTCAEQGARLVDFCPDLGLPKGSPDDYAALDYLRNGVADALLIVRTPFLYDVPSDDLLESLCLPPGQPMTWVSAPELRLLGLLPPAVRVPTYARQRATVLQDRGFPDHVIARWLDSEGFAPPSRRATRWTAHDIRRLLSPAPRSRSRVRVHAA